MNFITKTKLHKHDVVCDTSKKYRGHDGNERFRHMIQRNLSAYAKAAKTEKSDIITRILVDIHECLPHVGFVKIDPLEGLIYKLEENQAREKISQAFRDSLNSLRKGLVNKKKGKHKSVRAFLRTKDLPRPVSEAPVKSNIQAAKEHLPQNCPQGSKVPLLAETKMILPSPALCSVGTCTSSNEPCAGLQHSWDKRQMGETRINCSSNIETLEQHRFDWYTPYFHGREADHVRPPNRNGGPPRDSCCFSNAPHAKTFQQQRFSAGLVPLDAICLDPWKGTKIDENNVQGGIHSCDAEDSAFSLDLFDMLEQFVEVRGVPETSGDVLEPYPFFYF